MDYHTQLWNLLISLTLFVLFVNSQKAERDIDICEAIIGSRARRVHMYNPDFPQYSSGKKHCNCTVSSSKGLPLTVSIRILISSSPTSLMLNYQQADTPVTWIWYSSNITAGGLNGGGLLVTDSASSVEVIYRDTDALKSVFGLDVEAFNGSDELRISCTNNLNTTDDNSSSVPAVVKTFLESFCSAYIIIILGSLCAAFFLIIITLSVMLCCTVKKSKELHRRYSDTTNQPLSNQSSLGLPMESYRVASRIYDDGVARRGSSNVEQYPVPRHHSVPTIRESVGYANTMEMMNLYGNT